MSKVILVTGASSGIGAAIATTLSARGFTVYAAARRVDRMAALESRGIRTVPLDLTDETSIVGAMGRVLGEAGRIDGLVNNAGYGAYGAVEEMPIDEARRQFEVNLFGLGRLVQLALPSMRAARSGWIVNVSSIGGRIHEPMGAWYHASKFALEGLSDCLRMELAPFGIDVVVIQPGAIPTEWSGIAREHLLATSAGGPYAGEARTAAGLLSAAERRGSPPTVVADAALAALTARRPPTRIAVGEGASTLLRLRAILSDRAFDGLMRTVSRRMARG